MAILIGIDEVGRGAWAGPLLVVAAVQLRSLPRDLADSKLLPVKAREELLPRIIASCRLGEGWVQPEEIDEHGLTRATRLGVQRALFAAGADFNDEIIIDGHINYCAPEYKRAQAIIKADRSHPVVSAASIYAKVTRDTYMRRLTRFYPEYGLEKHVGYGTKFHREALARLGVTSLHRRSYQPVKAYL